MGREPAVDAPALAMDEECGGGLVDVERTRAGDDGGKRADVLGPVLTGEITDRGGREARRTVGDPRDEPLDERRDVVAPIGEWRNNDLARGEALEQVGAEAPRYDGGAQVAAGGYDPPGRVSTVDQIESGAPA